MNKEIKIPKLNGDYIHVYKPAGDIFPGPDSIELKANQYYSDWVVNDHHLIKGCDDKWHCLGITHPKTSINAIHDGEWLLFHAVSQESDLSISLKENSWSDEKKVLPPKDRPNESAAIHSPYLLKKGEEFIMVYGPAPFRYAVSNDLYNWNLKGLLVKDKEFSDNNLNQTPEELEKAVQAGIMGRDPMILLHDDMYYMVYCSNAYTIELITSKDFVNWSKPVAIYQCKQYDHPESPVLIYKEGFFYLFWCLWRQTDDIETSAYSDKTYVFTSKDPFNFNGLEPITELMAHAPEILQDNHGNWYISSAEKPNRGISIAKLEWE